MDVPIIIHNRINHSRIQTHVEIKEDDTIGTVEQRLSDKIKIPHDQLNILLCGKVLEQNTSIKDLLLGPTTCLVALAIEQKKDSTLKSESLVRSTPAIGSFYVWCKTCSDIQRGKLRVFCLSCNSTAVVVESDPTGWDDVLKSKRIRVYCEECDEQRYASFKFKCVSCSETCAPLSQIRGNWDKSECCICLDDSQLFVFDFGCNHSICRSCFLEYSTSCLKESKFLFQHPFGYTLSCPSLNCNQCLRDVHHLRIMGSEKYKQYQCIATEKLIALDEQGFFCPYPNCGYSFIWENSEGRMISCPECLKQFCRICIEIECICFSEDTTKETIAATTKKCPGCDSNTERSGGCAHMQCTSCKLHWCYRCVKPWTEECQFDHWFD